MRVIAKRAFISAQFGNVDAGQVIEMSEDYAKMLKEHGLVDISTSPAVKKNPGPKKEDSSADFTQPTEDNSGGSSSQADQASPGPTVKKSGSGGKTKRKRKSRS